MKKTIIAILLASTFSGVTIAKDKPECKSGITGLECDVQDIVGSATGGGIGALAPKEVREDLRKYTDSTVPREERRAMAAEYVKGLADGSISEQEVNAASSLFVKFKDGKAQDLNSSLIADGIAYMKSKGEITGNEKVTIAGKEVTLNEVLQTAHNNRIDGAKGIDHNLDTIQGEVDRRNDQQDHNTGDIARLGSMVGDANRSIGKIGEQVGKNTAQVGANKKDIKTLGNVVGDTNRAMGKAITDQKAWNKQAEDTYIQERDELRGFAGNNREVIKRNEGRIDQIEDNQNEFAKNMADISRANNENTRRSRANEERSVENEQRVKNIEDGNKERDQVIKDMNEHGIGGNARKIAENKADQAQWNADAEQAAKEYDAQIRGEFNQWERDAKKYVDDKIENGRQGRDSNSERIDENRRDIRNNTDQIAKNDKAIADANGRINDTNKRLDATNEQVDKNAKAIDVNRKGIKDNVKRIDSIEKDNVKRDQKIDSIGKKADENSKRIDDTTSRITDEVAKQDKVNKEAAAERKTNSDNIAKNGEAIKDTNKRLDATNEQVDKNAKNIDANKKRIDEELENQDKVNKQAKADREENRNKITDTNKRIDDEIAIGDEFAKQASDVVVSNADKISENSQQISRNSVRIDNLEDALVRQGEEMRERYDGVKASTHAAMSARAFTTEPGEFAVGAGIGAAGSKRALAIGGAYQFNENWSGNFIGSYETAGKYTKSDLAVGVGAQYTFK